MKFRPAWFALGVLIGTLLVYTARAEGEAEFHEYCSKCHALPEVRGKEVPKQMFDYVRAFGATDADVEAIRQYVQETQDAAK